MEEKEFESMPNCTSAFRFMGHYYCLHGHMFSKFDPKTGEVHGKYPKEARDYFMRCAKFSKLYLWESNMKCLDNHGQGMGRLFNIGLWSVCTSGEESDHVERERCSRVHLDAIAADNAGNFYAFRGEIYIFSPWHSRFLAESYVTVSKPCGG